MKVKLMLLALMLTLLAAAPSFADLSAVVVDGTATIRPTDDVSGAAEAQLFAAKNEYEPFQVVVFDSDGGSLAGVDAEVTALESKSGSAISADNVFLFREHFIYIDKPSHKPYSETTIGYWPDPLVPFVDRYFGEDRNGAPFDVPTGEKRVIWVEVYVPLDTPAGTYVGTMSVTAEGKPKVDIPITLTVWNFALPEKISLDSVFLFSCGLAYSGHVRYGGSPESRESLARMYFAEALRHRMTLDNLWCQFPPYTYDPDEQTVEIDFTAYDELVSDALDGNLIETSAEFTTARLPGASLPEEGMVLFWREWGNHFKEKGWFDKLFYYLPDEPTPDEYPYVAYLADLVHEADPELRPMVTEQFADELAGHVDIWCPDTPLFSDTYPWMPDPEIYRERQALGEEVWWYNCCSVESFFDYLSFFVDSPGIYARIFFWLTRRYHFTGVLYWQTIYAYSRTDKDMWEDAYEPNWLVNGDGTLYYPGTPDKIGGTHDIPVPSIRLKRIREGFEDYEYFRILDEMGHEAWLDEQLQRFCPKTYVWEHDTSKLYDLRRKLAEKILGTLDEQPPAVPQGLKGERDIDKATLSWSSSAKGASEYRVYAATELPNFFLATSTQKSSATVRGFGLQFDRPFWFAVSAVDEDGNESDLSEPLRLDYPSEGGEEEPEDEGESDWETSCGGCE